MSINWYRKFVWIVVTLVLLQSFAGIATATVAPGEKLAPSIGDICMLEMPDRMSLNNAQEGQCDELELARDEAESERQRVWDERAALQQAQLDRQSELHADCPEDLSIIACTADSVETARLEYEDELEQANAEYDIAFERWSELNAAWWDCRRADQAGEIYDPPADLLAEDEEAEEQSTTDADNNEERDDENDPVFADPIDADESGAEPGILQRLLGGIISAAEALVQGTINDFLFVAGFSEHLVVSTVDLAETIVFVVTHPGEALASIQSGISDAYNRGGGGWTGILEVGSLFNPAIGMVEAVPEYVEAYRNGDYHEAGRQAGKFVESLVTTIGVVVGGAALGKAALKRGGKIVKKVRSKPRSTPEVRRSPNTSAPSVQESASDAFLRRVRTSAQDAKRLSTQNTAIKETYEKIAEIYQQATSKLDADAPDTSADTGTGDTDRPTITGRVSKTPDDIGSTGNEDSSRNRP